MPPPSPPSSSAPVSPSWTSARSGCCRTPCDFPAVLQSSITRRLPRRARAGLTAGVACVPQPEDAGLRQRQLSLGPEAWRAQPSDNGAPQEEGTGQATHTIPELSAAQQSKTKTELTTSQTQKLTLLPPPFTEHLVSLSHRKFW